MDDLTVAERIIVQPLAWNTLQDIDDVRKIDDSDAPCLEEIRLVLEKYNCLNRFGVSLLHSHFQVAEDEMLLETTDPAKREHWVRPIKRSELERGGIVAQPNSSTLR